MTSIITRSDILAAVNSTIENEDARSAAIAAINRIYVTEHVANFSDDESSFFNLITHYDQLHDIDPQQYNQQFITEEASHALHA